MLKIVLTAVLFYLPLTCAEEQHNPTLKPETFANIYVETLLLSQSAADEDSTDYLQQALTKYHVSRQEFNESIAYYNRHPELWQQALQSIAAKLEEKNKQAN